MIHCGLMMKTCSGIWTGAAQQVARTAAFAVRFSSPGTPGEEAHGDQEVPVRKKRALQLRHSATLQRRGRDCDRKDADRKTGGPRYLLKNKPTDPGRI